MAKVIFYKKTDNPDKAKIVLIHGKPKQLSPERKKEGVELDIDKMPEKDQSKLNAGYRAVSYINPKTKEITYDYVKSDKQRKVEDLEARVEELETKVNQINGGKK